MFSQDVRSLVTLEGNQNLLLSGGEHIINYYLIKYSVL